MWVMSHGSLSRVPSFLSLLHQILVSEPFLDSSMEYMWETDLLISRSQAELNPGQLADGIWKHTETTRYQMACETEDANNLTAVLRSV